MNTPTSSVTPSQVPQTTLQNEEDDSINLLGILDLVLDQKWLIVVSTVVALLAGGLYTIVATPIYEANALIQIENTKGNLLTSLGGFSAEIGGEGIRSSVSAEIEILRSRLVLGQAVSNLGLNLLVTPKYLPVVGAWLARRATQVSKPGFLWLNGYVIGNESLQVAYFHAPATSFGQRYSVTLAEDHGYELRSPLGQLLGEGTFGAPLAFQIQGHAGEILVNSAVGMSGAEFYIILNSDFTAIQRLQANLKITEQGKGSGVLRVSLEGANPERISRSLNAIGKEYVHQNTQRKAAEAEKTIAFLKTQLPLLRQELDATETQFNKFRGREGTFDLATELESLLQQSVTLKDRRLEAQQRYQELKSRFTGEHPTVKTLKAQINALNAQIRKLENKVKTYPAVEQNLLRLTRDIEASSEVYTNLLNSFQQLRLVKEGKIADVRIVDQAIIPESPVKPNNFLVLALSSGLGLLAGLGLAFLRHMLHGGIHDSSVIEQELGLSVFAMVPYSRKQVQLMKTTPRQPLAVVAPNDYAIESLRSFGTALRFAMLEASNNIVLMAGPGPGLGKSFVSTNFATVFAAAGKRVLLVDADLRKGHTHEYFGVSRGLGLSDLVVQDLNPAQVIHKEILPNLDFVSTGALPPNPAEVLASPRIQQFLQQVASQYHTIIIDTPPVLAVADTSILASHAGTLFLVVRSQVSTLDEISEATKRLAQTGISVKGVVFNGLDTTRRRYARTSYVYNYQ